MGTLCVCRCDKNVQTILFYKIKIHNFINLIYKIKLKFYLSLINCIN